MSRIHKYSVTCERCFNIVASKEKNDATCAKLVRMKEFKENCLFYVKEDLFYSYFYRMEILFRSLEPFLVKINKALVDEKISTDRCIQNVTLPTCYQIKKKIKNKFIAFTLKIFGLRKNKENIRKAGKLEAELGSKSSAMRALAKLS